MSRDRSFSPSVFGFSYGVEGAEKGCWRGACTCMQKVSAKNHLELGHVRASDKSHSIDISVEAMRSWTIYQCTYLKSSKVRKREQHGQNRSNSTKASASCNIKRSHHDSSFRSPVTCADIDQNQAAERDPLRQQGDEPWQRDNKGP